MTVLRAFILIVLALFADVATFQGWTGVAVAQEAVEAPDYEAWNKLSVLARDAIDKRRASDDALGQLRTSLVEWRTKFQAAQGLNQARIATLSKQIESLGQVAEGETEPVELTERRKTLSDELAQLRLPVVQAEEAYRASDGLIDELDALIRSRQTDALLELGPSPLNPANWPLAAEALYETGSALNTEVLSARSNATERQVLTNKLPLISILLIGAIVLIFRGANLAEIATNAVRHRRIGPVRKLLSFTVSTGQVFIPLLGVYVLAEAVEISGIAGYRTELIVMQLPEAVFAFLVARWLGVRIFPKPGQDQPVLELNDALNAQGRLASATTGAMVGLYVLIDTLNDVIWNSAEAYAVAGFVLMFVASVSLFRLGQLLRHHFKIRQSLGPTRLRVSLMVAMLVKAASVIGVGLGGIGYFALGSMLIYSTAASLALLGFLQILNRLVAAAFEVVNPEEAENESLISIFVRFCFTLLSLPVFALIWGVRSATLLEWWQSFVSGVSIGGVTISPISFVTFAVIFSVGYVVTRLIQGSLRNSVLPKTKLDAGGQNAVVAGAGYTGIFLAAVIAITGAGFDLSSVAIVAGALSVGIGFGLQTIVSNFVSGIILLIERPITKGDWIEVAGQSGYVTDISVRSTRIETFDRAELIIPNSDLISGVVKNVTRTDTVGRVIVPVGVAYGTDTRKVEQILMDIAKAHDLVVVDPEPTVIFRGFGPSSLNFEIRAYLRDINWVMVALSDMNHEIARRFDEEGISIPFPQQDVWLRMADANGVKSDGEDV